MKRFRFRLQRILHLKEMEEQQRRHRLERCNRRVAEEEALVARATDAHAQATGQYAASAGGAVDLSGLARAHAYLGRTERVLRATRQRRRRVRAECDRARDELVEKKREVQTLGRLRERHHERYRIEAGRALQREADEVALRGHARRG